MTRAAHPAGTISPATRLPGLRFEVVPPQRPDVLPRMDIAAFAGFAASGPLHIPVLVEDAAQFESIFGDDLPLAWDSEQGEQVHAYLAPAVRAFFRNGGRRAWVVRVAGETAHTAWFPVPGLARFDGDTLRPAYASARSAGAWGDALRVGAALLSKPIKPLSSQTPCFDPVARTIDLFLGMSEQVGVGDVLRLTCPGDGFILFPVARLEPLEHAANTPEAASGPSARKVRASAQRFFRLRPVQQKPPIDAETTLAVYDHNGEIGKTAVTSLEVDAASDGRITIGIPGELSQPFKDACTPGAFVRVDFSFGGALWMLVSDYTTDGSGLQLSGQGVWLLDTAPEALTWGSPALIERLAFELWVRPPRQPLRRLGGLGFAAESPRFWAALPDDRELFSAQALAAMGDSSFAPQRVGPDDATVGARRETLWQSAQTPRFPLAGPGESGDIFLPFLMAALPKVYASPDAAPGDPLVSDGLDSFSAALFLDPDLADQGDETLLDRADALRYTNPRPRPLRGIHAVLSIEEVTLVAAPDAAQRGWFKPSAPESPAPPQPLPALERPEWWRFLPCNPPGQTPRTLEPKWGEFLRCDLRLVPASVLTVTSPDAGGSFTLSWTPSSDEASYILEESSFPDFSDAREIYRGPATHYDILAYSQGDYYYHVRAELDHPGSGVDSSDWSNGVVVRIAPGTTWQIIARDDYHSDALRAVQLNLLRMCAARGDMFAVLSIPGHLREQESMDYVLNLRSPFTPAIAVEMPTGKASIAALGYREARSLSFGALYHPWLYSPEEGSNSARLTPPDGCVTGILAQRAYDRGAWVAPANQPMRGVVALSPLIAPAHWLNLQQAHINLVRQEPQGFVILSENTLSDDPDWTLVNVRRLVSLLRRLAQRYGPTWVFEPNDEAFARLVKRMFTSLLDQMFARGAFAGRTPETSYQVNVQARPQDIDAGRFIVELRVAPSLPMRFITIRLVQSGERSLVTEGG